MSNTPWNAIPNTEACDILNFWATASWPMDMDRTISHASELGWTTEEDEDETFIVNAVSNFNNAYVDTTVMPSGDIASVHFYLTDTIRGDISDEATAFLNDQYTLYCREATARWGEGTHPDNQTTVWELGDDAGRITLALNPRSVTATFDTPQYAKVLRDLGE